MSVIKRFWWILPLLLLLAAAGFAAWGEIVPAPMPEALAAIKSDDQVIVETKPWLTFKPAQFQAKVGFIFYPGGRVDERSYAPAARAIAGQGYLVVIPRMPLHLAVLAPGVAAEIIAHYPAIKTWAIGGHSLGGSMAANYARLHPDQIKGLALWAAYPASSDDLSKLPIKVISISGSLDGLATPAKISSSRPLLPAETSWTVINGGDHAQFGWYGPQAGDNPATISRQDQQAQVIDATVAFLMGLQ